MEILKIIDSAFNKFGRIVDEYNFIDLINILENRSCPEATVIYEPSDSEMEALPIFSDICNDFYGNMDAQIGFCNGHNTKLNALEYHKASEINVAANDVVLLLGSLQDIDFNGSYTYDTSKVEAFLLPAGIAVELYGTTLHYAPCNVDDKGYRVAVILPKTTNSPLKVKSCSYGEGKMLFATNKWLIAHDEATNEIQNGAHIGLVGINIDISKN